jgi:hypothetical protein
MPDTPLTSLTSPDPPARRARRVGAAVLLAGSIALAGAACSPTSTESTSSSTTTSPTTTASTGSSAPSGSSTYATIAALHQAIVDGGFECTLEYPGLKDDVSNNEVSICTIEDEQAFLTIWADPANLAAFAASSDGSTGTVALGANWSISVTTPDLASRLATALDGTAPSAG